WREALLARWVGESANSLMPLGQVAGPVVMTRHLSRRGMATQSAAAAITVSTTLQALGQFLFGLIGVAMLALPARIESASARQEHRTVIIATLTASIVLAAILVSFYLVQRRGLFGGAVRRFARLARRRERPGLISRADAIDIAVEGTYRRGKHAAASFALSLVGWVIGSGEVYLALRLLGAPVGWRDALLLESLGQAIRGAAFAVPGALGVQEGGYLLLAPFAGLAPDAALALSFAKRARDRARRPRTHLPAPLRAGLAPLARRRHGNGLRPRFFVISRKYRYQGGSCAPSSWRQDADHVCSRRRTDNCPSAC